MPFSFHALDLPGVVLVEPKVFEDERGFFLEVFKGSDFTQAGLPSTFVQENHSASARGVLRGLHYQRAPRAQAKLVRVVAGEIFDAVVDMRKDSPTCGKWVGVCLSRENRHMLYVPPWCAHGFCVLSDRAEVVYLATDEYSPVDEGGIAWNDPAIGVAWPIAQPLVSARDSNLDAFEPLDPDIFKTEIK